MEQTDFSQLGFSQLQQLVGDLMYLPLGDDRLRDEVAIRITANLHTMPGNAYLGLPAAAEKAYDIADALVVERQRRFAQREAARVAAIANATKAPEQG